MTLFVMLLLLQFTAVTGQTSSSSIVRAGDEVTLPCENVVKNQDKCNGTNWLFSRFGSTEELVSLGKINNNVITKDISNRLGLTADCSLVITNVTTKDVSRYSCRQYDKAGKQQGSDAQVLLSVINMEEQKSTDTVFLFCTVLTYTGCEHTVQWLYEGNKNDVEILPSTCSAKVIFTTPHLNQKSKYYESLKCNVTDNKSGNKLLCTVGPQSSCEKPGITSVERNNTSSANNDTPNKGSNEGSNEDAVLKDMQKWWMWLIIVSVGLVALLIITVAVIRWKRAKGNRTRRDERTGLSLNQAVTPQDMADPEEGVSYASVSYTKKTNVKAQVRVKEEEEDDDAVTYSTVKAPSSSSSAAGASADLSNLYATVNKPKD